MNTERKHIIIAGVPRAGKTTLGSYLSDTPKYQHIAMDGIIIGIEKGFPETGVKNTDCWEFLSTSNKIINFIKALSITTNYDRLPYRLAMDLYHITPQLYSENIDKECCDICFLGYPNISIEEKLKQIRKFDTKWDWTSRRDDEDVKAHIKDYIEISKWLEKECEKYNLPFIDTSENREKTLREFADKICEK